MTYIETHYVLIIGVLEVFCSIQTNSVEHSYSGTDLLTFFNIYMIPKLFTLFSDEVMVWMVAKSLLFTCIYVKE